MRRPARAATYSLSDDYGNPGAQEEPKTPISLRPMRRRNYFGRETREPTQSACPCGDRVTLQDTSWHAGQGLICDESAAERSCTSPRHTSASQLKSRRAERRIASGFQRSAHLVCGGGRDHRAHRHRLRDRLVWRRARSGAAAVNLPLRRSAVCGMVPSASCATPADART